MRKAFFILGLVIFNICSFSAQKSDSRTYEYRYEQAVDLFQKEKYSDAIDVFSDYLKKNGSVNSLKYQNTRFYISIAELKLFHKNADERAELVLREIPENALYNDLIIELSDYYFLKRKWEDVLKWIPLASLHNIGTEKQVEFKFKMAYAYFNVEDFKNASNYFYELKETDSKYKDPSVYYFSHISYLDGNYNTALKGFEQIQDNSAFSFIAPYYIANIYFELAQYQKLIDYLQPQIDNMLPARQKELYRLLGESYYHMGQYQKSTVYLEKSLSVSDENEVFHLANAFYLSNNYEKAIEYFEQAISLNDSLNQLIYYNLAHSYLKQGKQKSAYGAFKEASKLSIYPDIEEESAFSLAKISYDASLDPYQETITLLTKFLEKYPESSKKREAEEYLVNIFLISNNYEQSILQMERMELELPKLQEAYQKACYNYGVEKFRQTQYDAAIALFNKSLKYNTDKYINALSAYWIGESYYLQEDFSNAIKWYENFIYSPGAVILSEFSYAHYNIAYAYYKIEDFKNALTWFRKFTAEDEIDNKPMLGDAYIKIGDIFFRQKDYIAAIESYQEAQQLELKNKDYILYQQAMAFGLVGRKEEKKQTLLALVHEHENSSFVLESKWQLAKIYNFENKPQKTLDLLNEITTSAPVNSAVYKKALMEKGQVEYNLNKNTEALKTYQAYVEQFPNYNDSRIALNQIKKIYIEEDRLSDYKQFISGLSFVDLSQSTLDTTSYEAAYYQYIDGNCERAISGFESYIKDVQQGVLGGVFLVESHFYKSECHFKNKDFERALQGYAYVTKQSYNLFTEKSLLKAARIEYESKHYKEALAHYFALEEIAEYKSNILESKFYIMKCSYFLGEYDNAIHYSNKVMVSDAISEEERLEAYIISARSSLELGNLSYALEQFNTITDFKSSVHYSEAIYNIALIHFTKEQYELSEKKIMELLNGDIVNKHWLAQGLILLSDIYVLRDDLFQAKQTLLSVIDNHDEPAVVEIAKSKVEAIEDKEKIGRGNLENDFILPEINGNGTQDDIEQEFFLDDETNDL